MGEFSLSDNYNYSMKRSNSIPNMQTSSDVYGGHELNSSGMQSPDIEYGIHLAEKIKDLKISSIESPTPKSWRIDHSSFTPSIND